MPLAAPRQPRAVARRARAASHGSACTTTASKNVVPRKVERIAQPAAYGGSNFSRIFGHYGLAA
jgi:hypothetical protein